MKIQIPAKAISLVQEEFSDKEGKLVEYFKFIFIIDGEVVEVNSKNVDIKQYVQENLMEEKSYIFNLKKNLYGTYKFTLAPEQP